MFKLRKNSLNIEIISSALRLGEGGEYILNGNYMVMPQKIIIRPGLTIEYSGPVSPVERLNTSEPIDTDLILEVSYKKSNFYWFNSQGVNWLF